MNNPPPLIMELVTPQDKNSNTITIIILNFKAKYIDKYVYEYQKTKKNKTGIECNADY